MPHIATSRDWSTRYGVRRNGSRQRLDNVYASKASKRHCQKLRVAKERPERQTAFGASRVCVGCAMTKGKERRRRLTKAERAILEADRLAALIADAPAEGTDPLAPPAFIADRRMAPALQVWRDHAPYVARLGCLQRGDRLTFALLCVYTAEFAMAQDDLLKHGFSMKVKTIAGGHMLRDNPSLARRDTAAKMMLDLSARFGLSPLDRHKLFAVQGRALDSPLFDEIGLPAQRAKPQADADVPVVSQPSEWDLLLRGPEHAKPN